MEASVIIIKGKVIGTSELFEKDNFKKRELYVKTNDRFPQELAIEFTNEKESLLDYVMEGEEVEVFVNIRGRSWLNREGKIKYFISLQAWKLEKVK